MSDEKRYVSTGQLIYKDELSERKDPPQTLSPGSLIPAGFFGHGNSYDHALVDKMIKRGSIKPYGVAVAEAAAAEADANDGFGDIPTPEGAEDAADVSGSGFSVSDIAGDPAAKAAGNLDQDADGKADSATTDAAAAADGTNAAKADGTQKGDVGKTDTSNPGARGKGSKTAGKK